MSEATGAVSPNQQPSLEATLASLATSLDELRMLVPSVSYERHLYVPGETDTDGLRVRIGETVGERNRRSISLTVPCENPNGGASGFLMQFENSAGDETSLVRVYKSFDGKEPPARVREAALMDILVNRELPAGVGRYLFTYLTALRRSGADRDKVEWMNVTNDAFEKVWSEVNADMDAADQPTQYTYTYNTEVNGQHVFIDASDEVPDADGTRRRRNPNLPYTRITVADDLDFQQLGPDHAMYANAPEVYCVDLSAGEQGSHDPAALPARAERIAGIVQRVVDAEYWAHFAPLA